MRQTPPKTWRNSAHATEAIRSAPERLAEDVFEKQVQEQVALMHQSKAASSKRSSAT
ncbi:MAG TPA: hypothetical protein VIA80_03625 [Hyphomonadaceae bacterium]|jgi:hypothetical protein